MAPLSKLNFFQKELDQGNGLPFGSGRVSERANSLKKQAYAHIFERISIIMHYRKILVVLFLALSIAFHLMLVEGIYLLSKSKVTQSEKEKPNRVAFKIKPPERAQVSGKITPSETEPKTGEKKRPVNEKAEKPKIKSLSPQELEALGKENMALVREGTFPPLTLSYHSPASYIRDLYALGAKTVIYDREHRVYYAIDLFKGDILPMSSDDFKGFSSFKRVIKDPEWDHEKMRAATRINASPELIQILLLVPLPVEQRWIGHFVNIFRQMNINISEIETIEARFQGSRLKVVRLHLKDGSLRDVNDPGCA